jgi:hypothetical protein
MDDGRWTIGKRKLTLVTKVQSAQVTFRLLPANWKVGGRRSAASETCVVEAVLKVDPAAAAAAAAAPRRFHVVKRAE